ncbi:coatomer subunit beta'-2-like isoform X2 [Phalaenopsis equestris]|uniref:coatomer subunit beta'-2-like isoform X2 n=1 Tax=Phalaenopsis equestris TaxID=78828 RepID=UPI0009E4C418|nr:coatomer subunit beta'-2-like isoform X2 [Phalaenopsis equestris]
MIKIGREVLVASMDNGGKNIWAKHDEIQTVKIKAIGSDIQVREENGEHEEREQEVEADDSTNGAAIVSGNDDDDEWALTSFE